LYLWRVKLLKGTGFCCFYPVEKPEIAIEISAFGSKIAVRTLWMFFWPIGGTCRTLWKFARPLSAPFSILWKHDRPLDRPFRNIWKRLRYHGEGFRNFWSYYL